MFSGSISESGDLIVGDTFLRNFMPLQVKEREIVTRWCVVVKYLYLNLWCSLNEMHWYQDIHKTRIFSEILHSIISGHKKNLLNEPSGINK